MINEGLETKKSKEKNRHGQIQREAYSGGRYIQALVPQKRGHVGIQYRVDRAGMLC
jgi:hypothetical protein